MKAAIVHPWFLEAGGGERVAEVILELFPDAPLFTLAADPNLLPSSFHDRPLVLSKLNGLILHFGSLRNYVFPLYPWAIERFDVSAFDLVISSCPPVMGVNVRQDAVHVCYCHTPQHSWWDAYAEHQSKLSSLKRNVYVQAAVFHRMWEFQAMQRVDHIIANSNYVARRIHKYFRRRSTVIYPPVNTSVGYLEPQTEDYYLTVSRLTRNKRIDLLIDACNLLKRRLVIVGTGPHEAELKARAGSTVEFAGRLPDEQMWPVYAKCRAFLFASDEDFGMAPVEAQAFGRSVIAYGYGGSLETVRVNDPIGRSDTGTYFREQTVPSVVDAIRSFEANESQFAPGEIQQHARQFDVSVFSEKMRQFVHSALQEQAALYPATGVRSMPNR